VNASAGTQRQANTRPPVLGRFAFYGTHEREVAQASLQSHHITNVSNTMGPDLEATVTRYTLAKLQRIQVLIPLGVLNSTAARRFPGILTLSIGLAVMLAFWLVLRSAVTRFGVQIVRVDGDAVWLGSGISVPRDSVRWWTCSKGAITLICGGTTYRLRMKRDGETGIERCLRSLLGAPTRPQRRGSPRARLIAGAIMVGGVAALICGFVVNSVALACIGVPSMLLGFGAFAALSSRRAVT